MGSKDIIIDARYKGVRGWLLLFCIGLTIIRPLATAINIVSGYSQTPPFFNTHPRLLAIFIVYSVLEIALTVFGIYTGILLWRIRPKAVRTAKSYLWASLGYSILIFFLFSLVGLPTGGFGMGGEEKLVIVIIIFTIWYLYFLKSKRVNATYETTY